MKNHLESSGYLADQQNGFRKNRSTSIPPAALIYEISERLDKGELVATALIDYQNAFDMVDHKILIWKMEKAGMGPKTCKLLTNYL